MIARSIGLFLAGVLLVSAIEHAKNPFFFLGTVYSYDLLDSNFELWAAAILPTSQFLLSAMVFAQIWHAGVALVISSLFALFVFAQGLALAKGLVIPCGCFGVESNTSIGWQSLFWVLSILFVSLFYAVCCIYEHNASKRCTITENAEK